MKQQVYDLALLHILNDYLYIHKQLHPGLKFVRDVQIFVHTQINR